MSKRDPDLLLEDIAAAMEKIERYVDGLALDTFKADEKTVDAVVRNLEVIGEAVNKLPKLYKENHSDIPWQQVAGLRNRIVHEYFGLDLEMIWFIISSDLPQFRGRVLELLA
jgi:uncharacterized protein with HEPN domain